MPKRRNRRRRNKAGRALIIDALARQKQAQTQSTEIDKTEPTKSSGGRGVMTKRKHTSSKANTTVKRACTDKRHVGTNVPRQPESVSKIFETVLESFSSENSLDSGTLSDRLNSKHRFFDPELKDSWKKFTKKQRKQLVQMDAKVLHAERVKSNVSIKFPFETAEDNHCETSAGAYSHVAPLLALLAQQLGKSRASLRIYDPFFCSGAVKRHLAGLGFRTVYNKCEDFYAVWRSGRVPVHDVVVSNPPYDQDHVQRLLQFCAVNGKPCLLLLPNYVCAKPFFATWTAQLNGASTSVMGGWMAEPVRYVDDKADRGSDKCAEGVHKSDKCPEGVHKSDQCTEGVDKCEQQTKMRCSSSGCSCARKFPVCFVAPRKRYHYWTPKGLRSRASGKLQNHVVRGLGFRTSPFISFWYLSLLRPTLCHFRLRQWHENLEKNPQRTDCSLYMNRRAMPKSIAPSS